MPKELMQNLKEQLEGYEELARAAEEQLDRILQGDIQGFDRAAARREVLQKRIAVCEERIRSVLQDSPNPSVPLEMRQEIERVALEIQKLDGEALVKVKEMRDEAARRLDRFKRGCEGLKGYGRRPRLAPRFVDRKG